MPERQRVVDEDDRILQVCSSLFARIVDKIAENPARYLEELMGLS
jgi:hypothetical protein